MAGRLYFTISGAGARKELKKLSGAMEVTMSNLSKVLAAKAKAKSKPEAETKERFPRPKVVLTETELVLTFPVGQVMREKDNGNVVIASTSGNLQVQLESGALLTVSANAWL